MRMVVAVMAPFAAAEPIALTQSPTAMSLAAAVCVALTVVELDVVIFKDCVWSVGGVLAFALELVPDFALLDPLPFVVRLAVVLALLPCAPLLALPPLLLPEPVPPLPGRAKLPGAKMTPVTDTVEPLTLVTFPDAKPNEASDAPPGRRKVPDGNEGCVSPFSPLPPPGA
jgi:hypothetical protein